jgi:adenylate kinase family enzyme
MANAKLIIISGLSATGKTTFSKKIAEQFKLPLFATDKLKEFVFDQVNNGMMKTCLGR